MQGKWIDKIFMGYESDAERVLPNRPKEIEDEEEKAYEEFVNSLTEKQKQKYVQFFLKKVVARHLNRK